MFCDLLDDIVLCCIVGGLSSCLELFRVALICSVSCCALLRSCVVCGFMLFVCAVPDYVVLCSVRCVGAFFGFVVLCCVVLCWCWSFGL